MARAEISRVFCEPRRLEALRLLLPALCLARIERECELPRRAVLPPPPLPRVRLAEREPVFD
ncbi:MAG TPA: hypothetical protein VND24_05940 [Steroidobacteraceae bacterium]|nr:hypothetical protein [Steroidobacteraceae bacterium]